VLFGFLQPIHLYPMKFQRLLIFYGIFLCFVLIFEFSFLYNLWLSIPLFFIISLIFIFTYFYDFIKTTQGDVTVIMMRLSMLLVFSIVLFLSHRFNIIKMMHIFNQKKNIQFLNEIYMKRNEIKKNFVVFNNARTIY
jgi:flagellar biosynthesis protein FlhB